MCAARKITSGRGSRRHDRPSCRGTPRLAHHENQNFFSLTSNLCALLRPRSRQKRGRPAQRGVRTRSRATKAQCHRAPKCSSPKASPRKTCPPDRGAQARSAAAPQRAKPRPSVVLGGSAWRPGNSENQRRSEEGRHCAHYSFQVLQARIVEIVPRVCVTYKHWWQRVEKRSRTR